MTQVKFTKGLPFLLFSGFISTILSIWIDMAGLELGALIKYFWPGFLTIALIAAFGILCLITKKVVVRLLDTNYSMCLLDLCRGSITPWQRLLASCIVVTNNIGV